MQFQGITSTHETPYKRECITGDQSTPWPFSSALQSFLTPHPAVRVSTHSRHIVREFAPLCRPSPSPHSRPKSPLRGLGKGSILSLELRRAAMLVDTFERPLRPVSQHLGRCVSTPVWHIAVGYIGSQGPSPRSKIVLLKQLRPHVVYTSSERVSHSSTHRGIGINQSVLAFCTSTAASWASTTRTRRAKQSERREGGTRTQSCSPFRALRQACEQGCPQVEPFLPTHCIGPSPIPSPHSRAARQTSAGHRANLLPLSLARAA
jgi:hypothetical protein